MYYMREIPVWENEWLPVYKALAVWQIAVVLSFEQLSRSDWNHTLLSQITLYKCRSECWLYIGALWSCLCLSAVSHWSCYIYECYWVTMDLSQSRAQWSTTWWLMGVIVAGQGGGILGVNQSSHRANCLTATLSLDDHCIAFYHGKKEVDKLKSTIFRRSRCVTKWSEN